MKYNPDIHHRRSIRLKEYDYSQAEGYYVTIVTQNRVCLFGDVVDGKMVLNDWGRIVQRCWLEIPQHYPSVSLDEFIIMPNHTHGIIMINDQIQNCGVKNFESQRNRYQHIIPRSLGSMVRGFKIGVTKWFRKNTDVYNVWQRNYWEHVIRNDYDLNQIREYIITNPLKWELDDENPQRSISKS